ncbi:MAG: uroporphyrinogen decarboxylase family protein [Armatimonadota bacterium]
MTPKQRFLAAVRRQTPDMVPVSPLIHTRFAHKLTGRGDWRAVFEVHQMLGSVDFRGPSGVGFVAEKGEGFGSEIRVLNQRDGREVREHVMHTPRGTLRSRHVTGMIPGDPTVGKKVEYEVKSPEDWAIVQDDWEEWLRVARPELSGITEAWETMGEEGVASVGLGSAFSMLGDARGMQNLLTDLYDCPDVIHELLGTATRMVERHVQAFLECPAEVLWYDICWATGAGMSPETFAEFSLPDIARVAEMVAPVEGKHVGLYTLGRMRRILPMLVDTGVDFIETFEPNEGDITLREGKQTYGDRVCIMGNFDSVILARGTVEEARREARRCLEEGMEGGGYVMVTGDEVPADAKMDNLRAMVEVVDEHGRY